MRLRGSLKPFMASSRHTEVSYDLLDHVLQHSSAVLGVQEGQELLLVQQLVRGVVVRLEPAVLQALQHLLSCTQEPRGSELQLHQLKVKTVRKKQPLLSSSSFRSSFFLIFSAISFSLKPLLARNLTRYSSQVTRPEQIRVK